jgi:ERCC4-type nuclease
MYNIYNFFLIYLLNDLKNNQSIKLMEIIVDYREKQLIPLLENLKIKGKFKNLEIKRENLPIGDVIIKDKNGEEKLIIERKSVSDLAASIKDGRYAEQSFRLNNNRLHNHNIIYLIEGDIRYWNNKGGKYTNIKAKTLYVTLFSLQYYKGFSIVRTFNIGETAEYILRLSDKMLRDKKGSYYDISFNKTTNIKDYCDVVNKVKKKNIKPENIGEIILSQIPGISSITSRVILEKYGSLYKLLMAMKKDDKCLNKLTIKVGDKKRKISNTSIRNIYNYLLYQENNVIEINTK